jgi:ElaB/YqjD/DUF883 family membrane-anchored ribosome-binding protein
MRGNGDAGKDPRQLEREVEEQRRHLGETIHALEERISPNAIYDQAAGYVRSHGGEFAQNFGRSVKANPLPVALTAIGLAWMMFGERRQPAGYRPFERPHPHHDITNDLYGNSTSIYGHNAGEGGYYGEGYSSGESRTDKMKGKGQELKGKAQGKTEELKHRGAEMGQQMKGKMSSARDRASAAGQDFRHRASATGHQLRDSAGHAREGISHTMNSARSNFEYYMREQPLAMGAIGIALGALVGASLPRTRTEYQLMGDVSERARHKAQEMAQEGYQRASEVGESVGRQAKEALDSQRGTEQRAQTKPSSPQGPSTTT